MSVEIRPKVEEREVEFLKPDELRKLIAKELRGVMERQRIVFEYGETRMEDIVAISDKDRARQVKARRKQLIELGLDQLERWEKRGLIDPNFFRGGVADKSDFVAEAIELAVEMIDKEKKEKQER